MVEKKIVSKTVMLGDMNVGKTTLVSAFMNITGPVKASIGQDFKSKNVKVGNYSVAMQVWDPAGQEQFQAIGFGFYRGADVCLLIFDLSDKKSFEELAKWKSNFLEHASPKDPAKFPFVVVGNKTDKPRIVTDQEAREWC